MPNKDAAVTQSPKTDTGADKLRAALVVIDRLEVGPTRIEKRRVRAPYRITRMGSTDVFELEYSFEEDVFDANDPVAANLASLMMAQVALNYGLFCKEIAFAGSYDTSDQRFLRDMAENTAREIYVMKFLRDNPFLTGQAVGVPVIKQSSYLHAQLTFRNITDSADGRPDSEASETSLSRYAVLSSGGKDSLLSFGLLKEMGCETHPIFVNESGRHWFTALNAYRDFKEKHRETARVWTNSDRLFTWMLRHLPFVRKDFAQVRSDEYPIRLWTVAVFLFGVLPVLRKRGIGCLVIGDEFDTSVRSSHQGITHYNGLYDQSRYFDNALSRFFQKKGWGLMQFSLLRPLSELLIEKLLAERYPELLKHQLSCHAAHTKGDRVFPCGKCEKCRRIVGMLLAIGADPKTCGYTSEQIEQCLAELAQKGVHQEAAGAAHLFHLLHEKGLIQSNARPPKAHPETMKLRIDKEHSPIEGIPTALRKRLFEIFLKQADGAVQRVGRAWADYNPLADPAMLRPYIQEANLKKKKPAKAIRTPESTSRSEYILGELTWEEAEVRFKEVDVALLPVGAIEQHGPHLPLDTDAFDAEYLAQQVAAKCSHPRPLVLPLIPYGVSYHHDDFAGTISITNETLARLVYEIGMAAARNGITKLLIINGHGGNSSTLQFAAQMINRDAHIFTCVDTGETSDTDINELADTSSDVHAGEIETSTTLALRPNLVNMKKAGKFVPHFSSRYLNFSSNRRVEWNARTSKISKSGVLGDPTKATIEKGQRFWEIMIQNLVEFVEQLKNIPLKEIYERRY